MPETKDLFHQFVPTLCVMDTYLSFKVFKFQVVVGRPPTSSGHEMMAKTHHSSQAYGCCSALACEAPGG